MTQKAPLESGCCGWTCQTGGLRTFYILNIFLQNDSVHSFFSLAIICTLLGNTFVKQCAVCVIVCSEHTYSAYSRWTTLLDKGTRLCVALPKNATTCPWLWRLPSVTRPGTLPDLHKPCVHRLGFILLGPEGRGFGTLFSAIY